jgi:hypothetical protein
MAELLDSVNNLLNLPAAQQLLQLNSNTCERAYEAYVLSLCVEAVRRAGGSAQLVGIKSGSNPNPVVFRGAPGSMASTNQDFAYVSCALKNRAFELHVDVEYEGTSGAPHEIDVSMCDKAHGDAVRKTDGTPKTEGNKLLMAFECKFYAEAWPEEPIVQQLAAQLPWGHHMVLLDRVKDRLRAAARITAHNGSFICHNPVF